MLSTWTFPSILRFQPLPEPPSLEVWVHFSELISALSIEPCQNQRLAGNPYYPGLLDYRREKLRPNEKKVESKVTVSQWQSWNQIQESNFEPSAMLILDFTLAKENSISWRSSKDLGVPGKMENVSWETWLDRSICEKGQGFWLPGRVSESVLW